MAHTKIAPDKDIIIIGAGISGICFAHRLQERCPDLSYSILERRSELGGTWSFFRYPGIRCDSNLYTYGFPWAPWVQNQALAKGSAILQYIHATAQQDGIEQNILLDRKVEGFSWSSETQMWSVNILTSSSTKELLRSRFVFLATGYFDYDQPLRTEIPGIDSFEGDVLHPQSWPDHYNYKDKSVVVIGSGATAITLIPAMADHAKHITMLQRSPSYVMSVPVEDRLERMIRRIAPRSIAARLIRLKWILLPAVFRALCTMFPLAARSFMRRLTQSQLKQGESVDPDFNPSYNPFDQRMCMCPDGDFYQCLRSDKASVKTGVIATVTPSSIKLQSGEELHPDLIVTATGLKLRIGGNISIDIDGAPFHLQDSFVWRGLMFESLPNLFFSFGYLDASWTLGVDTSAQLACKLLAQMKKDGAGAIMPKRNEAEKWNMKECSLMPLTSTYVVKARSELPRVGENTPWQPRSSYMWEQLVLKFGNCGRGLEWLPAPDRVRRDR